MQPLEAHAELWRQQGRVLGELEEMARRPATGPTAPDLHDLHRVRGALLARPFDRDGFAVKLAAFLALAGVTPDEFEEAARTAA